MTRVVLADDTIVENCGIGATAFGIWVNVKNMDLMTAARLFGDPEKTRLMRFEYGSMYDEFEGYTQLSVINCDRENEIRIRLTGGTVKVTGGEIEP